MRQACDIHNTPHVKMLWARLKTKSTHARYQNHPHNRSTTELDGEQNPNKPENREPHGTSGIHREQLTCTQSFSPLGPRPSACFMAPPVCFVTLHSSHGVTDASWRRDKVIVDLG